MPIIIEILIFLGVVGSIIWVGIKNTAQMVSTGVKEKMKEREERLNLNKDSSTTNSHTKNNATSESTVHCYLKKSSIGREILNNTKEISYNQILQEEDIGDYFRLIIASFLIPYRISVIKYILNKECFDAKIPISSSLYYNEQRKATTAPSLLLIMENPWDLARGYPDWFYCAFPDVAYWAIKGRGYKLIMARYDGYDDEEFVEDGNIKLSILKEIINMYIEKEKNILECKEYFS